MLETVLQYGTARAAAIGQFAAGKTGTTSNYGDAWFVGWDSKYTVAVWVGYPNGLVPMTTQFDGGPVLGGTFPALIWHDFMISALQIDKTRAEQAAATAAARATGKHGQSTTSTSEEASAPSSGSSGASQSGEEGAAERHSGHSSPNTGGGGAEHGSSPPSPAPPAAPAPSSPSTPAAPSPAEKLARAQRRRRQLRSDGRGQRQSVGRGRDTWRLPATQKRHGKLHRLGDANARARHHRRLAPPVGARTDRDPAGTQVAAVLRQLDAERLGQLAGPRAEVPSRGTRSPIRPRRARISSIPRERLERADQHRRADALGLADGVQQRVDAVGAVHVRVPRLAEQGLRARRQPDERVTGGLALVVGLRLDDHPAAPASSTMQPIRSRATSTTGRS